MDRWIASKRIQERVLMGALVVLSLALLGCWAYALNFEQKMRRTFKIDLPAATAKTDAKGPPQAKEPAPAEMPKELKELIKTKGLFGRPPDPTWQVTGVLGDAALVNGQWMEKGHPNGNVTVKEIGANKVVLEIDGQPREFQVWPAMP